MLTNIEPGDGGAYSPMIDPAHFSSVVDNPYLPFLPGTRWVYQGVNENEEHETTTIEVLTETRTVMGVPATVVHDLVEIGGKVVEDTSDWYAQDDQGNVWYLGEDTTAYDGGSASKEGSWEAGVDGALPGIVMPATPEVGTNGYRQEYRPGEAEDMALVVAVGGDQTVGTVYRDVVVTQEWTPLEPDITEQKSYAPGVGLITEDLVRGGTEHHELVSFRATRSPLAFALQVLGRPCIRTQDGVGPCDTFDLQFRGAEGIEPLTPSMGTPQLEEVQLHGSVWAVSRSERLHRGGRPSCRILTRSGTRFVKPRGRVITR